MIVRCVIIRLTWGKEVQMDPLRMLVGLLVFAGTLLLGVGFAGEFSDGQIITGFVFAGIAGLIASVSFGRPV